MMHLSFHIKALTYMYICWHSHPVVLHTHFPKENTHTLMYTHTHHTHRHIINAVLCTHTNVYTHTYDYICYTPIYMYIYIPPFSCSHSHIHRQEIFRGTHAILLGTGSKFLIVHKKSSVSSWLSSPFFRLGYHIPMFIGFIIMFLSTVSEYCLFPAFTCLPEGHYSDPVLISNETSLEPRAPMHEIR